MMTDTFTMLTWIGTGVALGFLLAVRLVGGGTRQDKDEKVRALAVETEALKRTNSIYRERIDQLEDTLFSNKKYHQMAKEIQRLSAGNYKLRSQLRDMECLVQAERKRNTRDRVEQLERKVQTLKRQLQEKEKYRPETLIPVEVLPAGNEVAIAVDPGLCKKNEPLQEPDKGWSTISRARRI